MSVQENRAKRARETIAILTAREQAMPTGEIWSEVESRVPLDSEESVILKSGESRGRNNWRWASDDLAKAGWLRKDPSGSGSWSATDEGKAALSEWVDPIEFTNTARQRYLAWMDARAAKRSEDVRTIVLPTDQKQEKVISVARDYVNRGFKDGASVFSPVRSVWNAEVVSELVNLFADAENPGGEGFVDNLTLQLTQATDDAKLLMAEVVALQLLPIAEAIGQRAKSQRVETLLNLMEHPVVIPPKIIDAFSGGAFNPGPGMMSNVAAGTSIIVRLLSAWFDLDTEKQTTLLDDPLLWRNFVSSIQGARFPSQRNALLYLVHPEYFGPNVSEAKKLLVRDAFVGEIGGTTGDIDEDLYRITLALQQSASGPVRFYEEPYLSRWALPQLDKNELEDETTHEQVEETPPLTIEDLARELHMSSAWLEHQVAVLRAKRQVVFYGPPGTGKTYLALALGRFLSGGSKTTTVVQFHPSYSYEDFFEGYRPVVDSAGSLSFSLRPGPLRRIADEARRNPEFDYVLVIDEINRGNLSKVFGELYFLLEYRDQSISLLYGRSTDSDAPEQFSLPRNVYIIGTMNTADRSIALMDAAMRRRFAFVELHPEREPIRGMFESWLSGRPFAVALPRILAELNRRVPDDAMKIGPSYFMKADMTIEQLGMIWELELMPLLEEMHFGDGTNVRALYDLTKVLDSAGVLREGAESMTGDDNDGEREPQ